MRKKDQGLRDEFIQFVTQHQQEFYRLAFRYTHEPDGAMDVVQEALEKALRALPSLRQPEYMKTWFYRILVNESLTYLRKNKRELLPLQQALEELPALLPPDHGSSRRHRPAGTPAENGGHAALFFRHEVF